MDILIKRVNCFGVRANFPKSLAKNLYVYVDSCDQRSLYLLAGKRLRGFKALRAWRLKDRRYTLIACEVDKREEAAFLEAMEELHRGLLIKGFRDYEAYCESVFAKVPQVG